MNCYPELTLAMYLDGETDDALSAAVQDHLDSCPGCRFVTSALRRENHLLAEAIETGIAATEAPWTAPAQRRCASMSAAAMLGFAFLLGLPLNWLAGDRPPTVDLGLSLGVVSYLLSQLPSLLSVAAGICIFMLAAEFLGRRRLRLERLILPLLVVVALAVPSQAVTVRKGQHLIHIGAGETVDQTLVAIGQEVHIDGTVNGDLIALGETVVVSGTVNGDLVAAGQSVEIRGKVAGNLLLGGKAANLSGQVHGNVYAAGSNVHLLQGSLVEGEVIGAGETLDFDGEVKRCVLAAGQTAIVSGTIGRDLGAYCDRLSILAPAHIAGKTRANVPAANRVSVEQGAVVAGGVDTRVTPRPHKEETSPFLTASFYWGMLREFVAALIAGCVLFLVARGFFTGAAMRARSFWRSFGLGFAILIATPMALIIVAVTWVGLPLALIALAAYLAALYLSKIVVAAFLGQIFLAAPVTRPRDWILVLLAGLLVLTVTFHLPYHIGFGLRVAALCFGLGALTWQAYRSVRPV